MTERFWAIIDQARQGRPASVDAKALARVLNFLSDREVSAFGHMFMGEALRPHFLGIVGCRLHHRGMSDDGFHYFRSWIIGTGKSVFDVAMRNPDGIGPWIDDREVDNQSLEYVAVEIMKRRGGRDPGELSDGNPEDMPRGRAFDQKTVAKVCPTLASPFR